RFALFDFAIEHFALKTPRLNVHGHGNDHARERNCQHTGGMGGLVSAARDGRCQYHDPEYQNNAAENSCDKCETLHRSEPQLNSKFLPSTKSDSATAAAGT